MDYIIFKAGEQMVQIDLSLEINTEGSKVFLLIVDA